MRVLTGESAHHKPLRDYAYEIEADWVNLHPAAAPYLLAMSSLDQIEDFYGLDPATSIVLYFLSNATSWRGETARRIKKELKAIVEACDRRIAERNSKKVYGVEVPEMQKPKIVKDEE